MRREFELGEVIAERKLVFEANAGGRQDVLADTLQDCASQDTRHGERQQAKADEPAEQTATYTQQLNDMAVHFLPPY